MANRITVVVLACLALGTSSISSALPSNVIAPFQSATTEGNSSDGGTFGEGGGGDFRMQTVVSSSEFNGFGSSFLITGLSYRPDASPQGGGDSSGWSTTPVAVTQQIVLSTSTKKVDQLSLTFADNTGSDAAVVLNGTVHVSSFNTLMADGTKAFDIYVPFSTPFLYDPSRGDLLIDSRTLSGGNLRSHTVDGVQTLGDSVSSVRTLFGNGGAQVALVGNTYATIFQLHLSPVPEVSTPLLLAVGLGLVACLRMSRVSPHSRR